MKRSNKRKGNEKIPSSNSVIKWAMANSRNKMLFYELGIEMLLVEGNPIEEEKAAERIIKQLNKLVNDWEAKNEKIKKRKKP
jgi:hypothetical protein